ncbi:mannose-6-phosphate isomerase, class I [Micropruina sp.]|uniref:mannose-6-phosphate isomerase, class I n=1 Tax=Micropruina sp. TaxID=2737536 RepID=UPI0039E39433
MFIELTNTPRDYAWGAFDGIAAFTGRPASGAPEAELWFGTHPGSPSHTPRTFPSSASAHANLRDWVAADPEGLLGSAEAAELPILLKVLAARTPLSLQVHPSAEQAQQGYADEVARGVAAEAFSRSYKDPHPKPEIIVAVSETFEALCGFRPADEVAVFAEDLASVLAASTTATAPLLRLRDVPTAVEPVVDWLLSGRPDAADCVAAVTAVARDGAVAGLRSATTFATVAELNAHYPDDPGVVIAALLNRVTLRRGECLYAPAGTLHAYLRGVGIELMTASDNVLRGGLTPKHVDNQELLRVLSFEQGDPSLLAPRRPAAHLTVYAPPAPFALTVCELADQEQRIGSGPAIVLVESGSIAVNGRDGSAPLAKGCAVFVPASEKDVQISGTGRVWLATTGSAPV